MVSGFISKWRKERDYWFGRGCSGHGLRIMALLSTVTRFNLLT